MTTATLEMSTPVDVLNHKKRFAEVLDTKEAARTAFDKIKAAPRAAREGLASVLHALHLDAVTEFVSGKTSTLLAWVRERGTWLYGWVGSMLGWQNVAAFIATHRPTRNKVLFGAVVVYDTVFHQPLAFLGRLLRKVPFIGAPVIDAIASVALKVEDVVADAAIKAADWLDARDNHPAFRWLRSGAQWALVRRMIHSLVPRQFRMIAWSAYFLRAWGPQTVEAAKKVAKDPTVTKVAGIAKSAAAKSQEVVVDRIMDGPDTPKVVYTTQPGTEAMDIIVVATGQRATVTVDIDSRGQKWITWDGVTYAAEEIGQGENDPIRPLPIDVVTKAMKAEEAAKASAAAAGAPPLSRAVARATGGTPARNRGKAKASTGRR